MSNLFHALLVVLLAAGAAGGSGVGAEAAAAGIGSHSQLHACCTAPSAQDAMFREAKASGASSIRLDIEMHGVFTTGPFGITFRDWSGVDRLARLSHRYDLAVDAVLLGSPVPAPGCATGPTYCPPADPDAWGAQAGEIAARHAGGGLDTFEIWNEPDGPALTGTPEDYGRLLASGYDGIKARAPDARVVLGGTQQPDAAGTAWLHRAFRTPGADVPQKFDIGSIHLRGRVAGMVGQLRDRRAFFAGWGRTVPTWVTEHGYAATAMWQRDPAFRGGEREQAEYLSRSLPALARAGAQQIFVTLLDAGPGPYESEGIVQGSDTPGVPLLRRPAFEAVRRAALEASR